MAGEKKVSPILDDRPDVTIAQERKGRIQVIPLDVKPYEVPLLLSSYQMVSFRRDYDAGLSQLANILDVHVTPPELVRPPRHAPPLVTIMSKAARPTVTERPLLFEPQLVRIPAGEFLMGTREDETYGETYRVLHGGSWPSGHSNVRCAFRYGHSLRYRSNDVGFRGVRDSP